MNNVMALCHFCEQHGPSIMFTCEKVVANKVESGFDIQNSQSSDANSDFASGAGTDGDMLSLSSLDSLTSSVTLSNRDNTKKTDLCQACRSLDEKEQGFVSHDRPSGVSYTSMQHPNNPEVFRLVRQACVRSLSCEVCPGREGPILFGDEQHGYVISYTFYVKDFLARGGRRWYSIIYIMMDRVFLVQSWPFLVGCMNRVVQYLQKKAESVYSSESAEHPPPPASFKSRIHNAVTPRNFRQQRGDNSNARSLVVLTGNKTLYQYLHTAFTWIMRACVKRLRETVVEGTPTDEEIVRGELLVRSQSSSSTAEDESRDLHMLSLTALTPDEIDRSATIFSSLRHMRDILQPPLFRAIVWHLLIGNQVIWRGRDQELITSALHVLKDVLPVGCVKILTSSDAYVNPYKANLLGLNDKVVIPSHVTASEHFVLIDVLPKTSATQRLNQIYPSLPSLFESSPTSLRGTDFHMTSGSMIPEKGPSMLNKLEVVLANDSLSEEVALQSLLCLKQEWINKVKVLYKFTKIDSRNKEDTGKLLQNSLFCTEEDVRMMKFWMTGLSDQFKGELRQTALSQS